MDVYQLLNALRRDPALCVLDKKSLKELHAYLSGYEAGVSSCGQTTGVVGDLRPFNVWVAKQLGFTGPTRGWCRMILSSAQSDEEAFDLFFELLDKYLGEK